MGLPVPVILTAVSYSVISAAVIYLNVLIVDWEIVEHKYMESLLCQLVFFFCLVYIYVSAWRIGIFVAPLGTTTLALIVTAVAVSIRRQTRGKKAFLFFLVSCSKTVTA